MDATDDLIRCLLRLPDNTTEDTKIGLLMGIGVSAYGLDLFENPKMAAEAGLQVVLHEQPRIIDGEDG